MIIYSLLISPLLWIVTTLLLNFVLIVTLTFFWRTYKLIWNRERNLRPVSWRDAILISGATSGIGLALAKHLFKLGYTVIVGYYTSSEPGYQELIELKKQSAASGEKHTIEFIELDVRSRASCAAAFEKCAMFLIEHDLDLYALVNNAGLGSLQPFAWLQRQKIFDLIETNLLGSLLMTREFLPLLVQSRGRILNVSSGLGLVPGATYATYGITKSAQIYFTRSLNMELASKYGVHSVAVIPHNFIKNTNICSMNVKTNQEAWLELKILEQELYRDEFQEHSKLAKALEDATKEHVKLASKCATTTKGLLSSTKSQEKRMSKGLFASFASLSKVVEIARELVTRLRGQNAALTLEQSGALECFEDALRLRCPPEHIFAGDRIYNLLVGSILLSMPTSCIGLLGASVSPSLYR